MDRWDVVLGAIGFMISLWQVMALHVHHDYIVVAQITLLHND